MMRFAILAFTTSLIAASAQAAWETPTLATAVITQQAAASAPAPGITATIREPFYKITTADVGDAIAVQLRTQGVVEKAEVQLNAGTPTVLYSADHAITLAIHTLQIDPQTKRWQAQAYFLGQGKTESVVPVSGTYGAMIDVPVLSRQFSRTDVIADTDIQLRPTPERLLRKDTITDPKQLIGLSPRNGISPNRPIRTAEVASPIVIKRGDLVEMVYNTPYIHIKTTGVALEDGSKGGMIRIKNQKSERAVSARVEAAGKVAVNGETTL